MRVKNVLVRTVTATRVTTRPWSDDLGERLLGEFDYGRVDFGAVGQVAGERDHVAARARQPTAGADVGVAAALGQQQNPQPGGRAERRGEQLRVGGRPGRRRW